jgi:lipocalin
MNILPVDQFDLTLFLGQWFQFANRKQWYEPSGFYNPYAIYTLQADGSVSVTNRLTVDGVERTIEGTLLPTDTLREFKVKLDKVFLGFSVTSDYAIQTLITDSTGAYRFAIIGKLLDSSSGAFYVLSRAQNLTCDEQDFVLRQLVGLGYKLKNIRFAPQVCPVLMIRGY